MYKIHFAMVKKKRKGFYAVVGKVPDPSGFFLSAECENYPWKRGDKVRGEKNIFFFVKMV